MLISASILDKNKYQLVKEAIQKIAPEATIYEEYNDIIDIFDKECIDDEICDVCEYKEYVVSEEDIVNIRKQICTNVSNTGLTSSWNDFHEEVNKAIENYLKNKY